MLDGTYKTVDEYLAVPEDVQSVESCDGAHTDEPCACEHDHESAPDAEPRKIVYYATDENVQAQYIAMFRANGIEAVLLQHVLDNHFVTFLEAKNPGVKFRRIDSDLSELEKTPEDSADGARVEALFAGHTDVKAVKTSHLAAGGGARRPGALRGEPPYAGDGADVRRDGERRVHVPGGARWW